jgi:hypothetical protein
MELDSLAHFLTWGIDHPRELGIWFLLVHPIWLTFLVALLVVWFVARLKLWRRHKRILTAALLGAGALYALDAAIALPRLAYAWRSPDHPVINRKVQLPATLVLVNADCRKECHARLLSGRLEEVILVETHARFYPAAQPARRYRAGWSLPGECPPERLKAVHWSVQQLGKEGFCPVVESIELPSEGIFVVQEGFGVTSHEKAAPFSPGPRYLTQSPPGKIITFRAVEVQLRTQQKVEVIAARQTYDAPGLIGLPPLIGCWDRPDNIVWILPAGDTGCGLWRWFTGGGDRHWHDEDIEWIFSDVFT